jgi:hypothetical protein
MEKSFSKKIATNSSDRVFTYLEFTHHIVQTKHMKNTAQRRPQIIAIAVASLMVVCLPLISPAHAEDLTPGSSAPLPIDTQLVSDLKQSILLLNQGSRSYGGHRVRAINLLNRALACYNDHLDPQRIRGLRNMTTASKAYLSQAKTRLEAAQARAPKDSEPQRFIGNAITQIDECLEYHGAD